MTISVLKPKETAIFENEQLSRFSPESVNSGTTPAYGDLLWGRLDLSADATSLLDSGITIHNRMGGSLWAMRLVDDVAVVDDGAYTLENDGVLSTASQLAVVLGDRDDSISNYVITINGFDAGASPVNDVITFPGSSKIQFTTNSYKSVTSIVGGAITGTFSGDILRVVPRLADAAHEMVTRAHDPFLINNSVEDDPTEDAGTGYVDKGAYLEAQFTTDKEVRVSFPDLPPETRFIGTVRLFWNTQNIGANTAGIDYVLRHSGVNYILGNNGVAGSEVGGSSASVTYTLAIAPGTGNPWTVDQFNSIEAGVIFKGETPAVVKRFMRVRLQVEFYTVASNTDIDPDVDSDGAYVEAVSGDPFDEGSGDDGKYIRHFGINGNFIEFDFPDLPSEAVGVNTVKGFWRCCEIARNHPNGGAENTYHCAKGGTSGAATDSVQPRGGTGWHYGRGPLEQTNNGGWRCGMDAGSLERFGDEGNGRISPGPGNPSDSPCGFPSGAASGRNQPWGTFINFDVTLTGTPVFDNPWTVALYNSLTVRIEVGNRGYDEHRWAKIYAEPEWLRDPTGDTYFHLVVRDDLSTPNDSEYMSSQHANDKQFGCNFAGIDEVTAVNSIKGTVRGWTTAGATRGWTIKLEVNGTQFDAPGSPEYMNTTPEDKEAIWTEHPTEFRPWTRDEVNNAILIFEAKGENAYYAKFVSNMGLTVDADAIPDKIDTARRLGSEVLLYAGQPIPILQMRVPFVLGDAKLINDVSISHDAIPQVEKTLGLERWDRSLFRLVEKELDPNTDTWLHRLYDLRDFLVTFVMSGQAVTKGRSFDGMSLITPGANMQFVRPTNDYQEDPFADLIQELQANEPPTNQDGILIQNGGINRVINSAFAEGAVDTFDDWTKVGLPATGASIVEEAETIYDEETGIVRCVRYTGADTPTDIYLSQDVTLPTGDTLSPEGSRHQLTITHEDVSGQPLSVWLRGLPVGGSETNYNPLDDSWAIGNPTWFTLPIRSTPFRDKLIAPFATLHDQFQSPTSEKVNYKFNLRIGVRTSANQVNRLYDVGTEGGTIAGNDELMFPRSRILTRTGPVVRDAAELYVDNVFDSPVYPMARGTGFCVIETLWDSAELPVNTGRRRYVFGMVISGSNREELFYDCDNEEFVYNRIIAGVTFSATKKFRSIVKDVPIRIAWRWISSEGDLGETPFSNQIFINDERGTDGAPTSSPAQPGSARFYLGSLDGSNGEMLDGRMRRMRITQQVLSLDRIKKLR